jgi:hypothetical protein
VRIGIAGNHACAILILGKNRKTLNKHQSGKIVLGSLEKIQEDCPVEQSSWLDVALVSKLELIMHCNLHDPL